MRHPLAVVTMLIALALTPFMAGEAVAGPKIEIDNTRLVMGDVPQGPPLTAVFEIRNTGDEVLKIEKVQPG